MAEVRVGAPKQVIVQLDGVISWDPLIDKCLSLDL